jgi:hypothetical protein
MSPLFPRKMDDRRIATTARGACRIVDGATGLSVAEVKWKTMMAGVVLGNDMLTLAADSGVDRSVITGLVLVHGLIKTSTTPCDETPPVMIS